MKLTVAQQLIDKNISNDCKKKIRKTAQYLARLTRKDNAYVQMRDVVVVALKILTCAKESSDSVKTSVNGHEALNQLFEQIFEKESNEEGEVK